MTTEKIIGILDSVLWTRNASDFNKRFLADTIMTAITEERKEAYRKMAAKKKSQKEKRLKRKKTTTVKLKKCRLS